MQNNLNKQSFHGHKCTIPVVGDWKKADILICIKLSISCVLDVDGAFRSYVVTDSHDLWLDCHVYVPLRKVSFYSVFFVSCGFIYLHM